MAKKFERFRNILSGAFIVFVTILLIMLVLTRMMGDTPNVFGYSGFLIASPSMEPYIKTGDFIISKGYSAGDQLEIGDVITYNGRVGELDGKRITHEIIEINEKDGKKEIITKGRANFEADPPVAEEDVIGVMVCKARVIGLLYRIISTVPGFIILFVIPTVSLIIDEIKNIKRIISE